MSMTERQIADTIIDQVGRNTRMCIGARDFDVLDYTPARRGGVQFRVTIHRNTHPLVSPVPTEVGGVEQHWVDDERSGWIVGGEGNAYLVRSEA